MHIYGYGAGPSLDQLSAQGNFGIVTAGASTRARAQGLFAQGNFGIVTAAGFELFPRPEAETVVVARWDSEDALAALIDTLASLRRRGLLQGIAHVGNFERTRSTLEPLAAEQLLQLGLCTQSDARAMAAALLQSGGSAPGVRSGW